MVGGCGAASYKVSKEWCGVIQGEQGVVRRHAEKESKTKFMEAVPKHLAAFRPYTPREILRVKFRPFVLLRFSE